MILRSKENRTAPGAITATVLAVALLVPPRSATAEPARIPVSECELNGFGLGGTADQMREALGEPDRISVEKQPWNDYPHIDYHYDGLRIAFSTFGRSAMTFFVTSERYRLRSDVGVGSTRLEIESALGVAGEVRAGDTLYLTYVCTGPDGRSTLGPLEFKLEREIAVKLTIGRWAP